MLYPSCGRDKDVVEVSVEVPGDVDVDAPLVSGLLILLTAPSEPRLSSAV